MDDSPTSPYLSLVEREGDRVSRTGRFISTIRSSFNSSSSGIISNLGSRARRRGNRYQSNKFKVRWTIRVFLDTFLAPKNEAAKTRQEKNKSSQNTFDVLELVIVNVYGLSHKLQMKCLCRIDFSFLGIDCIFFSLKHVLLISMLLIKTISV